MEEMQGVVTRGINNIYSIIPLEMMGSFIDAPVYSCRIKGKVLQGLEDVYNPLAVGDHVLFIPHTGKEGMVVSRLERKNSFERWNAKRDCNQTVVANMDLMICVTSVDDPPFRPRFIDRVLTCSHGIPVMIVLNKCDLMLSVDENERFELYKKLGYETFSMSAFDEKGIVALRSLLQGKTCAFVGQSGVGKSTLVNALFSGEGTQKIGGISDKYHRGRHTTNHSLMLQGPGFIMVDTPGIREILIPHDDPYSIGESFPEFREPAKHCSFQRCLHDHEPGCKVKEQVEIGLIHPDRYESYLRMLASLEERPENWESDRR